MNGQLLELCAVFRNIFFISCDAMLSERCGVHAGFRDDGCGANEVESLRLAVLIEEMICDEWRIGLG